MGFGLDRKAKDWRDDWQDGDEALTEISEEEEEITEEDQYQDDGGEA